MSEKGRVFTLNVNTRLAAEGNIREFHGAIIVTPEPVEKQYVSGAWNYAVRVTSSAFLTVHYDKAIDYIREKHQDWIVIYPGSPMAVSFKPDSIDLQYYTPPD